MSTRSLIAVNDNGDLRVAYAHSDGYPTHMAKNLATLLEREGFESTVATLIDSDVDWSEIDAHTPDVTGVKPDRSAPYGTAGYQAHSLSFRPKFSNLPGWGVSHPGSGLGIKGTQDADGSIQLTNTAGTQWLYVLDPEARTLSVYHLSFLNASQPEHVATLDEAKLSSVDWDEVGARAGQ